MAGDPPKFYWDACVFLSWINDSPDRLPHIDWFLDRAGKDHEIITSVFTVAEVAFAEMEKNSGVIDNAVIEKIDALWNADDSPVKLVEVFPALAFEARDLARAVLAAKLGRLKGGDALHLATAMRHKVDQIHTYSKDWPNKAPVVGISIGPPISSTPQFAFPPHESQPDLTYLTIYPHMDAYPATVEAVEP